MEKTLFICPRCQQRAIRSPYSGDFVHKCFGNQTLANEDVLVIGDWEDYSGQDTSVPANVINAIPPNKLQGTRAGVEGDKFEQRDSRGFPKSRWRIRPHFEYIEDGNFKHKGAISDRNPKEYD